MQRMSRFVHEVSMRWSDMDAFRHINNSAYLAYMEQARVAMFFDRYGSFAQGTVISRHEIDYMRPVDYTDPVHIELWIEEIRPSRFTVAYELLDGGAVASRARSVCVPFDLAAGRPRRMSDSEREFLVPWQE